MFSDAQRRNEASCRGASYDGDTGWDESGVRSGWAGSMARATKTGPPQQDTASGSIPLAALVLDGTHRVGTHGPVEPAIWFLASGRMRTLLGPGSMTGEVDGR